MSAHARILTPIRLCILIAVLLTLFVYVCFDLLRAPETQTDLLENDLASLERHEIRPASADSTDQGEAMGKTVEEDASTSTEGESRSKEREKIAEQGDAAYCIKGRVVISAGEPIPKGLVVIAIPGPPPLAITSITNGRNPSNPFMRRHDWVEVRNRCPKTVVDESGEFNLKGVPKGPLYLTITHPYFRAVKDREFTPRLMSDDLNAKDGVDAELVLEAAGVIEGKLLKPDDSPASDATITLMGSVNSFFFFSGDKDIVSAFVETTDKKGAFRIEQVPVGHAMKLEATLEGCAPLKVDKVRAIARETVHMDLKFMTPAEISGTVTFASGEPAEDVEMELTPSKASFSSMETLGEKVKTETDETGRFRFENLSEGTYNITVMHPGYARDFVNGIKVYPGERVDDLEFVLDPGLSIAGVVQDTDGKRIPKAFINVKKTFSLLAVTERIQDEMHPLDTRSDPEGAFDVQGLKPGSYELGIKMDGYSPFTLKDVVAGTEDLVLTLQRGGIIRGIVLSSLTGEPVKDYLIQLEQTQGGAKSFMDQFGLLNKTQHPIHDEKGKFAVTSLAPGDYEISVKADGFSTYTMGGIALGQGDVWEGLIIELSDEASISGTVMDAKTGEPLEGASISLESGFMGMIKGFINKDAVYTDQHGDFRLGGLSAGSYRLSVMHPKYEDVSLEEIELQNSEDHTGLKVYMTKASTVHGYVWTARKKPIQGANIVVANMTGTRIKSDTSDEDGYYEISGLPEGSYNVTKMPDSLSFGGEDFMQSFMNGMQSRMIKLGKDEVLECNFVEEPPVETSGTELVGLVTAAGDPQAGIFLQLHKAGSAEEAKLPKTTTTNGEGRYSIKNVEPGEYTLLITRTAETVGSYSMIHYDIDVPRRSPYTFDIELPGGCIAGRVRDKNRLTPLKNVRVALYREDAHLNSAFLSESMGMRQAEIYTDGDGRFRITNLQAGKYRLRVGGENLLGLDSGGYAFRMLEDLRLTEDEQMDDLTVDLVKGGTLEGYVTDASGEPVSGASIHVRGPGQASFLDISEYHTDGSGYFRYPSLMPGSWTVRVMHADFAPFTQSNVVIEAGVSSKLNCTLTP